ncbi:MAG TPA: UDP-glucose 4-epimerase GalE [Bacillota bacterium]|nr:UDP-glucose 4-epimerase GalE [Bacillota bacterium]
MILVTGGAGYIGSHTCVRLLENGYDTAVIDNLVNSKKASLDRVKKITGKDMLFYQADMLDREKLRDIFRENDIEAVIHFAGLKAVGESVSIPLRYYHNNITGTLLLCETMAEFGCKKLVFSSSATVYGLADHVPVDETMPTSTTNPYGSTKLMIEHILTDLYNSDKEWSIVLLRYFNPIGAHESGLIGEDPNGIPNNLMPRLCSVARGKMEKLTVWGTDYPTHDGTGVRDYIHVLDLAEGHLAALGKCSESGVFTYNLGTGIGYSVYDLIHTFERVNGVKIPFENCARRPGDVAALYADCSRAERELGWKAKKTLDDMCRDTYRFIMKNPEGLKD